MPFGFGATEGADGAKRGVMAAAALVFFAFYGFDAVSTAAEETKNPCARPEGRHHRLDGALHGHLHGGRRCRARRLLVRRVLEERRAARLRHAHLGHPVAATLIAAAAVIALPTVILAFMYGQIAHLLRDGARRAAARAVLPRSASDAGSPVTMTVVTGIVVAIIAGFLPLKSIAELANAGTLCAFVAWRHA